jgi:muramoyltetrapeptide carboxypeptidase LdcA involved in peptidoglycan recycling
MNSYIPNNPTVAIVSPSWSGPNFAPQVYERGKQIFKEMFNATIVEMSLTKGDKETLYLNPKQRAEDINNAYRDSNIDMVVASIGGSDSIRILKYLDVDTIKKNPKPFMGFSDSSTILMYLNQLGVRTFHGPSIMAGFAEPQGLQDSQIAHMKDFLFGTWKEYNYQNFDLWCGDDLDWSASNFLDLKRNYQPNQGWIVSQGKGKVEGVLFGGSLEILEMLKGTSYYPSQDFLQDKILFLETSEEVFGINYVRFAIRSLGVQGVLNKVKAIVWGRTVGYTREEDVKQAEAIKKIVSQEFGLENLPIITGMDFGHTTPQWILPLGEKVIIDIDDMKMTVIREG